MPLMNFDKAKANKIKHLETTKQTDDVIVFKGKQRDL